MPSMDELLSLLSQHKIVTSVVLGLIILGVYLVRRSSKKDKGVTGSFSIPHRVAPRPPKNPDAGAGVGAPVKPPVDTGSAGEKVPK